MKNIKQSKLIAIATFTDELHQKYEQAVKEGRLKHVYIFKKAIELNIPGFSPN